MNRSTGIPLYVQIRERLRVELGQMEPGVPIPAEAELEKRFKVSRITVRRAVEELVDEGLLIRQQGRGTFVQKQKLTHELSRISSWSEQLRMLGYVPKTAHRKVVLEDPSSHVAETLRLAPGQKVIRMERVRLAGREPVSLMTNYLPEHLLPGFLQKKSKEESLYEVLERDYDIVPGLSVDTVGTRLASDNEATALRIERRAPVLNVRRVSYLDSGVPIEFAVVVSRGDRYEYQVTLHGRMRANNGPPKAAATMDMRMSVMEEVR